MKIAMIGQKGVPAVFGGVERHVEELAARLVERGHDVTVYTRPYYAPTTTKHYRGIRLVSLPSVRTKHLDAISHTLLATLHAVTHDFDVIHYHGVGPSLVSFLPRIMFSRAKVVATMHCLDRQHQKWGVFARAVLKAGEWASVSFPHQTIVVSKTLKRYCRLAYGRPVHYIPNGVSTQSQSKKTVAHNFKRFGLTRHGYVLTVSRLIPNKGIHYLIAAFKKIKTDKKLVIVGGGFYTDAYVKGLHDLAKGDSRIVFTGFLSGQPLAELFANAALFVAPSENEGLPIALLEAASYGLGILASDIPAHREIITVEKPPIGYLFKCGDVNDLASSITALLRRPASVHNIGERAQDRINVKYHWDDVAKKTERVYSGLVRAGSPQRFVAPARQPAE